MGSGGKNRLSVEEVERRVQLAHGGMVTMVGSTYKGMLKKALFVDKDHGEWWTKPGDVTFKKSGHPLRSLEKSRNTFTSKYGIGIINASQVEEIKEKKKATTFKNHGVKHPSQSKAIREKAQNTTLERHGALFPYQCSDIALKAAKKVNNPSTKIHWKTGEELFCQGGYEAKTVDYLNANQINFEWQPKTFKMPDGKTYRPDLYLSDTGIWVEIKGWMRKDAELKWDWLKSEYPNAELWNQKKLEEMGIL